MLSKEFISDVDAFKEFLAVCGDVYKRQEDALDAYVNTLQNTTFTLSAGTKNIQVSAEDLGVCVANTEVVEEALNLGKTGNLIARYKDKKDLEKEPKQFDILYGVNEDKVETLLGVNACLLYTSRCV